MGRADRKLATTLDLPAFSWPSTPTIGYTGIGMQERSVFAQPSSSPTSVEASAKRSVSLHDALCWGGGHDRTNAGWLEMSNSEIASLPAISHPRAVQENNPAILTG